MKTTRFAAFVAALMIVIMADMVFADKPKAGDTKKTTKKGESSLLDKSKDLLDSLDSAVDDLVDDGKKAVKETEPTLNKLGRKVEDKAGEAVDWTKDKTDDAVDWTEDALKKTKKKIKTWLDE